MDENHPNEARAFDWHFEHLTDDRTLANLTGSGPEIMDTRTVGFRLAALPLGQKVAAIALAVGIAAGSIVYASISPRRYRSYAVLSFNPSQAEALSQQARGVNQSSAARLAQTILSDSVLETVAGDSDQATANSRAKEVESLRSRLAISQISSSTLRVAWTGDDAAHTTAIAQGLSSFLASWTPANNGQNGKIDKSLTAGTKPESNIDSERPPTSPEGDDKSSQAQPAREEALLRVTISVLDSKLKVLETELHSMSGHKSAVSQQAERSGNAASRRTARGSAHVDDFRFVRLAASTSTSHSALARSWLVKTTAAGPATESDQARREQILKQISNLRTQRVLVQKRLKEAQRESAKAGSGHKQLVSQSAGVTRANAPTAVTANPIVNKPFALSQPVAYAREFGESRQQVGLTGVLAGLIFGLLYFAASLYRFRPVRDIGALKQRLPEDVLFVGSIEEFTR